MGSVVSKSSRPGLAIGDYAFLSDCHSAALVGVDGSIDWLCLPRFDAPSLFGRLLDPDVGHWSIRPTAPYEARRRYLPESLVLETEFTTATGTVTVTDALLFGAGERGHDVGLRAPHVLVRMVACITGRCELRSTVVPRPEYGIVRPRAETIDGGILFRGGASVVCVSAPPCDGIGSDAATWTLSLDAGERVGFALEHAGHGEAPPTVRSQRQIRRGLASTEASWRSWSRLHQSYDGPWRELVHHSGRVLRGLTYQPTGAIIAAPTTSLPETVGGERNWDYRFGWIRDASLTMQALWVAACPDEASRFLRWMINAAGASTTGPGLQVMYGVGGEHDLSERELDHLEGWRASRPVRVGNGAWRQTQLDIFGELLDAVWRLVEQLDDLDDTARAFLRDVASTAAARWREPDHGIWEARSEPRHYLYSKLMCWVALDRAVALAEFLRSDEQLAGWVSERDELRAQILTNGWSDAVGAFTQSFGADDLDASALLLAVTGFLPMSDPRMQATLERIVEQLSTADGLLYRYRSEDGLDGDEATFTLCSYWLVQCLALAGERDRAIALFEKVTSYANDVGLLSEEIDVASGELLGNFPQAFSHVGLVNAVWTIGPSP